MATVWDGGQGLLPLVDGYLNPSVMFAGDVDPRNMNNVMSPTAVNTWLWKCFIFQELTDFEVHLCKPGTQHMKIRCHRPVLARMETLASFLKDPTSSHVRIDTIAPISFLFILRCAYTDQYGYHTFFEGCFGQRKVSRSTRRVPEADEVVDDYYYGHEDEGDIEGVDYEEDEEETHNRLYHNPNADMLRTVRFYGPDTIQTTRVLGFKIFLDRFQRDEVGLQEGEGFGSICSNTDDCAMNLLNYSKEELLEYVKSVYANGRPGDEVRAGLAKKFAEDLGEISRKGYPENVIYTIQQAPEIMLDLFRVYI